MIKNYYIGVDIGGTKCAVILGSLECEKIKIIERLACNTKKENQYQETINEIIGMIYQIIENNNLTNEKIEAIGISCGGPLDSIKGEILSPPNLLGWDHVKIVEILEQEFHIPCFLQNDANACALAEWKFGAGKGCRNMIFLTFGTGMGAGLILNGNLYSGTNDMAGEIGHIRLQENGPVGYGKEGSFEGFCSGGGIAQIARAKVMECLQRGEHPSFCKDFESLEKLSAKVVAMAAYQGDTLAKEIFACSARNLGRALSIMIDFLNPEAIVMGSVYARSKELFQEELFSVIKKETLSNAEKVCRILPAGLGDEIGDYASLSVAVNGKLENKK